MQSDKDITIYLGVTNNCNASVIDEVSNCCALLTSKNANGGKLLLVTESNANYPLADYLINFEAGDVFLTRKDNAFNVKLANSQPLAEVLYALTASWFLANFVGHDYADYEACLINSNSLQLHILEIDNANNLKVYLKSKQQPKLPAAISCYIEPTGRHSSLVGFSEIGDVLQQSFDDVPLCVITMSARVSTQLESKIYLTCFY